MYRHKYDSEKQAHLCEHTGKHTTRRIWTNHGRAKAHNGGKLIPNSCEHCHEAGDEYKSVGQRLHELHERRTRCRIDRKHMSDKEPAYTKSKPRPTPEPKQPAPVSAAASTVFVCANPACLAVHSEDPHTCPTCGGYWATYPYIRARHWRDGDWHE